MAASAGSGAKAPPKPSAKLNPKTVDAFHGGKGRSIFASAYSSGTIPCRLEHGSVKHKLMWKENVELLGFDPLLVTCAEGIRETIHPYSFVARMAFKELLETSDSREKTLPLVARVVTSLRIVLSDKDATVFAAGLAAIVQLSNVVGPELNGHLKALLPSVAKRMMGKEHREDIVDALQRLEENGGRDALIMIKSKIPTYSSVLA